VITLLILMVTQRTSIGSIALHWNYLELTLYHTLCSARLLRSPFLGVLNKTYY